VIYSVNNMAKLGVVYISVFRSVILSRLRKAVGSDLGDFVIFVVFYVSLEQVVLGVAPVPLLIVCLYLPLLPEVCDTLTK
jgi:hypothetical protein